MDRNINFDTILGDAFRLLKSKPNLLVPFALVAMMTILVSIFAGTYVAELTADYVNDMNAIATPGVPATEAQSAQVFARVSTFFGSLAPLILVQIAIGIISVLFMTGLIFGIKSAIEKKDMSVGEMLSNGVSYGFNVFFSQLVGVLFIFWPIWLMLVFLFLGFTTMNPVFFMFAAAAAFLLLPWSVIVTLWISKRLGMIYVKLLAACFILFILTLIFPLFVILLILVMIPTILFAYIWLILSAMAISYVIPICTVYEGKGIQANIKRAFEFTRSNTKNMGILFIFLFLLMLVTSLIVMPLSLMATPTSLTYATGKVTPDMIFNGSMIIVTILSELISTVLMGSYIVVLFVIFYAYAKGIKKLPKTPKKK